MGKKISAAPPKAVDEAQVKRRNMIIIMVLGMIAMVALSAYVLNFKQTEVEVVRLKTTLNGSDPLNIDTDIVKYPMLERTYDELGVVTHTTADGTEVKEQVIIKWDDRETIRDTFMTNHVRSGSYLTKLDVTNTVTVRNPWLADMEPEQEIYQMEFNPATVNSRLLYPGTKLRARIVMSVANDKLEEVRKKVADANASASGSGVKDSIVGTPSTNSGSAIPSTTIDILTGEPVYTGEINTAAGGDFTGKTPIAEIVIPEIEIADMINANGESIFELYMALLKLPVDKRVDYLQTTLGDNEVSNEFQQRVSPVSVTFIVDKESATKLAEFEQMTGASIKYTILPDTGTNSLTMQFVELQTQISTATSNTIIAPSSDAASVGEVIE